MLVLAILAMTLVDGACAARDLPRGTVLGDSDIVAGCPGGASPAATHGASLVRAVGKGVALRPSLLTRLPAVRRGDCIAIVSGGDGFEVEASAEALSDAAAGEIVSVRNGARRAPRRVRAEGEGRATPID